MSIERLKAFCPYMGSYYLCFSGGKDSLCVYHLAKMAGVPFDAHYSITSVDPPELVKFIRDNYPDVEMEYPRDSKGNVLTMWNLIANSTIPPTRKYRYCCEKLKEAHGVDRVSLTGVRWAESARRANKVGLVMFMGKPTRTKKIAEYFGLDYKETNGGLITNDDNDLSRRMVENCYRTRKTLVNPIVDWEDDDVWEFIHKSDIKYCSLYDEGFKRMGCIACPMAGRSQRMRELERWPKYKQMYLNAFKKMIENNGDKIHAFDDMDPRPSPEEGAQILFDNWIDIHNQFGGA